MKKIEIKLPTGETREIEPSSESYVYRSVTDGNRLSLEWSEGVYRDYPVGLTAHVDGYDYTLYYPVEVRKVNTELLEYRATLHGREEELKMTKLKDVGSSTPLLSFVLTGKPTDFVRFVAKSMGEGWSIGQVIEGSERTLAFRHESCHDALARIAEEYHTEWHVDGTAISLSRLEVGREQPVALSYGMGKGFRSGVGRRSDGEETPIGRLFVEGGKRNIDPSKYGALTLRLPKGATYEYRGVTYRTDPTGSCITGASGSRTEGSYDGTDVYPRRVGRVTRVEMTKEGLVDIIDSTIPETLNYNDYRIGGEKAVIVFLSGMLTGREIEIEQTAKALSGYLHEERRFRLVSSEQDGQQMPGGSYMPKEGDTYAVYGISLPEEYVRTAEEELFHEACRYLSEEERERFRFDGQLDPVFAHREWGRIGGLIVPGGFVHFSDKQFYPRGSDIRIVSVRHPIGQPWAAELTLSGGPTSTGYLGSRLGRLEAEEILRRREEERRSRLQRQDYAQAVEAIGMISRAVKEVEGYTARIKPSVVETMGLLVGSEAGHFDFVEAVGSTKSVPFVPVVEAEKVVLPSSVLRHQTLGVKALTNKHRAEDFRYWTLPEYTSPALSDGTESYYIYAKVEREGSAGVFLLSREPIPMEKVTGYYHLLVGTVSSVVDGSRAYARLYGYSMLTPGALTVGAIESGDGNMRIDLEAGQIIVKHLRIGPPDASKDLQTELDDTVTKAELNGVVSAQEEHDIQAAKAALDAAKKAYDDAVKRAKELDGEIQVGGRNLLLKSDTAYSNTDYFVGRYDIADPSQMIAGETYTIRIWGEAEGVDYTESLWVYNSGGNTEVANIQQRANGAWSQTFEWRDDNDKLNRYLNIFRGANNPAYNKGSKTTIFRVKLERGSLATDWTPAPEDVQVEIDAAKEQATKAQTSTDKLRGYVDGAFRDGVVDDAEAKAIKTYINEVDAQWQSALGAYEKVYTNALLIGAPKTALLDCKTTLAGKVSDLTSYITSAISDGRATTAEVDGVNSRYNAYKSALRDFQRALKSAEESIRDAAVGEVGSGSLNYLPADMIRSDKNRSLINLRLAAGFFRAVPVGVEMPINIGYDVYFDNDRTDNKVKTTFFYTDEKDNYKDGSRRYIHYSITTGLKGRAWHHIWKSGKVARLDKHVRIMGWLADTVDTGTYPSEVRNVYLRVGSRDLGWTPAPEDVQAAIDAERAERETAVRAVEQGLANTDTLVSALEKAQSKLDQGILTKADTKDIQYLLDSLKNGDTQVAGGLVLSNDIILSDPKSKDVTASMSGTRTSGAKAIRLGIKYSGDHVDYLFNAPFFNAEYNNLTNLEDDNAREKRINELGYSVAEYDKSLRNWRVYPTEEKKDVGETTAFFNNGIAHIGGLFFNGEYISFGTEKDSYMQIGGTARSEYDMVNASTVIRKFGISGGTVRKSGTFVLDRFDSRYSNREIKYIAKLSVYANARAYEMPNNGYWDNNDHRYHKPEYREYFRTESSATAQLRLELRRGGSVIKTVTSPEVSVSVSARGGQFGINEQIPQGVLFADDRKSQAVTITISPSDVREQDTVTLSLVTTIRRACYHHNGTEEIDRYAEASASAEDIVNYLPYDTSTPMVSVTKDRAAFFYGRSKYVLLNYLESYVMKVVGNILLQGNLILKGDLTADSIICKSGGLYSGGVINEYGTVTRWVGRKITVWKVSTGRYKLSHNLGHINYVVQAIPVHSSDNNCFVIDGTETAHTVEVGVQWNSSWTNRAIHFVIYAQQ